MKKSLPLLLFIVIALAVAAYLSFDNHVVKQTKRTYNKLSPAELTIFRADYEFMKLRNPKTNEIPANIRNREILFSNEIARRAEKFKNKNKYFENRIDYAVHDLRNAGPENVCGRVLAIKEDVEQEGVLYAGTASGGLWKSTDGGQTWNKKTPKDDVQSATCIIQSERNPNIMYYGTGEMLSTTDRRISLSPRTLGIGNGIFKSTDRGETWKLLPSTISNDWKLENPFQGIWSMAIDESNMQVTTIYAACYGAIMKSTDGGASWVKCLGDDNNKSFCTFVVASDDGTVYAALGGFTTSGNKPETIGVFSSTDGVNWSDITPPEFDEDTRTIKLALAPSNQNVLYILSEKSIPDNDPTYGFTASEHRFFKGTKVDNNISWEDFSINLPGGGKGDIIDGTSDSLHGAFNSIGGYALCLNADPKDENMVFIGGICLFRNTKGFSDSTYNSWQGGYPYNNDFTDLHPDLHSIYFSRHDPNKLYIGCDGGVFVTNDYKKDVILWDWLGKGLNNTQFYWVSQDLAETRPDQFILGGVQDNAVYYKKSVYPPENEDWDYVIAGDGLTVKTADNKEFLLCSVYNGNIFSFTFDENMDVENLNYIRPDKYTDADFNFYTNFVLDQNDNKTFYLAGKTKIFRNSDISAVAKDTNMIEMGWYDIEVPNIGDDVISSLNISTYPSNILYVGTSQGRMFKIEEANGKDYDITDITSPLFPEGGFVSSIDIDRFDANEIIVVFSNYEVLSIFGSTDGGQTWESHSGNLEENDDGSGDGPSVRWISSWSPYPTNMKIFLAGTSLGLYFTQDLAGDETIWEEVGGDILGNLIVDMLEIRPDGYVAIATQGGGVYTAQIGITEGVDEVAKAQSIVYPNPSYGVVNIKLSGDNQGNAQVRVFDISGNIIHNKDIIISGKEPIITIDIGKKSSGLFFYKIEFDDKQIKGSFISVSK
jgi:hypothetical protein